MSYIFQVIMWSSICPLTYIINTIEIPFTVRDLQEAHAAASRCAIHYPSSPCMKEFRKVGVRTYNVICEKASQKYNPIPEGIQINETKDN